MIANEASKMGVALSPLVVSIFTRELKVLSRGDNFEFISIAATCFCFVTRHLNRVRCFLSERTADMEILCK